jgi:hypothetical protein
MTPVTWLIARLEAMRTVMFDVWREMESGR